MRITLERAAVVLAILALWQALPLSGWVDPFFVSSPSAVVAKIWEWISDGELTHHVAITATEAVLGLLLGSTLGAACGLACGINEGIQRACLPLMTIGNALPRLAFAPLLIAWFGFGLSSKIVLSASVVFFFIFFGVYSGLRAGSGLLVANARILGGGGIRLLRHVYLPQAFGWIIASLRLSVGYAFASAVIGEYLGSDSGLGYLIVYGKEMLDMTQVFAGLTVVILIVGCLDIGLRRLGQAGWRSATSQSPVNP